MNVTGSLQTILCAGVSHLVWPKNSTELLARKRGGKGLEVRRKVRRRLPEGTGRRTEAAKSGTSMGLRAR